MSFSMLVPKSADSAQVAIRVDGTAVAAASSEMNDLLLCAIASYRYYHQTDSAWVETRYGTPRLRLVGKYGSAEPPRRRSADVDLEDL